MYKLKVSVQYPKQQNFSELAAAYSEFKKTVVLNNNRVIIIYLKIMMWLLGSNHLQKNVK